MTRAYAINVGANTNEPGFRGPVYGDGRFVYLPIPETEATAESVPTYGDLDRELEYDIPESVHDRPVHLDPSFAGYPFCERDTYGDEHGVKAGRLSTLSAGDYCFFYATLTTAAEEPAEWIAPEWGAYLIGHLRLAADAVTDYAAAPSWLREHLAANAHRKRADPDAEVLLAGDPEASALYDRAIPLSSAAAGADANRLVTALSSDSGKGPWWRRPMGFDADATETLLSIREAGDRSRCFER